MHDELAKQCIRKSPQTLIPWWIMACWAYDVKDSPIISDALFDTIAQLIDKHWDDLNHPHKELLDRENIKGRLGMVGEWPLRAQSAAVSLMAGKAGYDISRGT